jgi:hypothetical protein
MVGADVSLFDKAIDPSGHYQTGENVMRHKLNLLWLLLCFGEPAADAQVGVGIGFSNVRIGINVPLYPDLVLVPGSPVYYAPGLNSNYFYYDGMYWAYQGDSWYASSWYNGPWAAVSPDDVPLYVLRIPVGYYRQPPAYFIGWQADAPPRWGEHWGSEWEHRRSGWDRGDRGSAPAPAPLPVYQRQYSGDRYPRAEEQHALQSQNDHYQPHDAQVRKQYEAQQGRGASASAGRAMQAAPQDRNSQPRVSQRSTLPPSVQQSTENAPRAQPSKKPVESVQRSAMAKAPAQVESPPVRHPQQEAGQRSQPAPTPGSPVTGPQGKGAPQELKQAEKPTQHPQQVIAQHPQPAPASRGPEPGPQGRGAPQEPKREQEQKQEPGREKADDHGQDRK